MNPIFGSYVTEATDYPKEIADSLKGHESVRITGLRKTGMIAQILDAKGPRGKVLSSIKTTPFKHSPNHVTFPFFVVEAKSEESGHPFSEITPQVAFVISELLDFQKELFNAPMENSRYPGKPLVWYLAHTGQEWRVYITGIEERGEGEKPNFVS